MAFGLRCIPGTHSWIGLPKLPLCPEWMPCAALEKHLAKTKLCRIYCFPRLFWIAPFVPYTALLCSESLHYAHRSHQRLHGAGDCYGGICGARLCSLFRYRRQALRDLLAIPFFNVSGMHIFVRNFYFNKKWNITNPVQRQIEYATECFIPVSIRRISDSHVQICTGDAWASDIARWESLCDLL